MAKPILYVPRPRDLLEEHFQELRRAPRKHAEALLDAYEILALLRQKGVLELLKGLVGSGEKVLEIATETLEADEVVRAIRNFVILVKILGAIEPSVLEKVVQSAALASEHEKTAQPPGLFKLLGALASPDTRRALSPLVSALQSAGRNLHAQKTERHKKPRQKVTRHGA
jgi:uncharacterized protein YjgD (DUF1641 family)